MVKLVNPYGEARKRDTDKMVRRLKRLKDHLSRSDFEKSVREYLGWKTLMKIYLGSAKVAAEYRDRSMVEYFLKKSENALERSYISILDLKTGEEGFVENPKAIFEGTLSQRRRVKAIRGLYEMCKQEVDEIFEATIK